MRHTKVFVADAASTDDTVAVTRSFHDRLSIHVIDGGMPSVGRNAGARLADSQYLLFLDADVVLPDRTMVRRAVASARSRCLHCLTVSIACHEGRWSDRLLYRGNNVVQRLSSWVMPFGTGMFLLCHRARFQELGGFAEDALFAEDFLFTRQISPLRFAVLRGELETSNRRFRKTGRLRMVWLFLWTMLNSGNRAHFQRDHGYWSPGTPAGAGQTARQAPRHAAEQVAAEPAGTPA